MPDAYVTDIDDLPNGCLICDETRTVLSANRYIADCLGLRKSEIVGQQRDALMSHASHLYCESYAYPLLLQNGACSELQLTFKTTAATNLPMVANAKRHPAGTTIWSLFSASNRDRIYEDLVCAREKMEIQSKRFAELAALDELTGLMNRRALNAKLEKQFDSCGETGQALSLIMLDLDDFKKINDTHGHTFGDEVLRRVGACIQSMCDDATLAGRFGGKEFLIAVFGHKALYAVDFANRLRTGISQDLLRLHPVSASLGIAGRLGRRGPPYSDLLNQADKALHRAKRLGKNQVFVGGDMRATSATARTHPSLATF